MTKQLPHISMIRFIFLSTLVLTLSMTSRNVTAEESLSTEEWDISADRITRYDKPMSIVAEGNIVLVKRKKVPPAQPVVRQDITEWSELLEEQPEPVELSPVDISEEIEDIYKTEVTITADWVAYDIALSTIKARGNVSVITEDDQLFAEQAVVNLEQETGTFKNATILSEDYDMHLEGEVIEKTGYKTYHIENGWVVTCKVKEGETPPWSFAAKDVVIKQGGYATLKGAKFKIKDTPILYSPWLMVPIKDQRQSGFLFPEFGTGGNDGFSFNLPFFWNISDSTDMTLYTQYMINRGYMPGVEFRYVKNANDQGLAIGNYLDDKLSDPSEVDYYEDTGFTHTNSDRYWIRAKADQEFGDGWTSRLDIDVVSDRDYLTEFNTGKTGFTSSNERFLDRFGRSLENKTDATRSNTFNILKTWGPMSLTGNLLAVNDVRSDKTGPSPLWQLPALDFNGALPVPTVGNFTFDWDATYAYFWREEGTGGHRVDLYPRLSAPVPLGPYLESRAELGLRDTYYSVQSFGDTEWDKDSSQNRFLYDLHAEVGSTLMRTFALTSGEDAGLNHQMRPFIEYNFLPDEDQSDLPNFTSIDRIEQQNNIAYGIDNFFDLLQGTSVARDYGYFKIRQSYSFLDEDSDEPFSPVNMRLNLKPLSSTDIIYRTDVDIYGDGFIRHNFEGTYSNSRGDLFGAGYIFDKTDNTEQINAVIRSALSVNWRVNFEIEHSLSQQETNQADLSFIYQALCWSVEFGGQYTPSDTTFLIVFNLANLGNPLGMEF